MAITRNRPRAFLLCAVLLLSAGRLSAARVKGDTPDVKPSFANVSYGKHERNVLDVYLAKSDKPTPVLIFFHGGGFISGDKSQAVEHGAGLLPVCLRNGISVVSANYRFVKHSPFPGMMEDGARAIQFTRSRAKQWNIDPDRVGLAGASAGGNMSVWIAVQDDMADARSVDPIAKYSTRVKCVIGMGAQTTNDVEYARENLYHGPEVHPCIYQFYGIKTLEELKTPQKRDMQRRASATNFVTKDDPAMMLLYTFPARPTPLPDSTSLNEVIHNPWFGKILKERMDKAGVECIVHSGDSPPAKGEVEQFLLKHLAR